jgi:uncharacterized protein (TIGR02145 family)
MNRLFSFALIFYLIVLSACSMEDTGPIVLKGSSVPEFDGSTVNIDGTAQTFTIDVSGQGWEIATTSTDTWIVAWKNNQKGISVMVTANESDFVRSSVITLHNSGNSASIKVEQDYIKYLKFAASSIRIDAAASKVKVPLNTNIPSDNISVSSEASWINNLAVEGVYAVFDAAANIDEQNPRSAVLKLSSGSFEASATVTQVPMSGQPYIAQIGSLDFSAYPIWELKNTDNGDKVGYACREYLYKIDPLNEKEIVNGTYTVVYTYRDGHVDYEQGRVYENGSTLSWGASPTASTKGCEHLAWFDPSSETPDGNIYLAKGSAGFRLEALDAAQAADAVTLLAEPVYFTDVRGTESFDYSLVKIGRQIWQQKNLRTSRFADGTPIATGVNRYTGWRPHVPGIYEVCDENGVAILDENGKKKTAISEILSPMCLISGTGSSNTFDDANDSSQAAITARLTYGCLYTYACIFGKDLNFPYTARANFSLTDKLSPQGWKVPGEDDFRILLNYLLQKSYPNEDAKMNDLLDKTHSDRSNTTGFSAIGSRQKGPSGGYNSALYYWSKDYRYAGGQHLISTMRLREGNYIPMFDLTVSSAVYIRLLKEDKN